VEAAPGPHRGPYTAESARTGLDDPASYFVAKHPAPSWPLATSTSLTSAFAGDRSQSLRHAGQQDLDFRFIGPARQSQTICCASTERVSSGPDARSASQGDSPSGLLSFDLPLRVIQRGIAAGTSQSRHRYTGKWLTPGDSLVLSGAARDDKGATFHFRL
jgi:hypothetical protein